MMIQPVVENAIIHGLSGMEGNGLIDISVQRDGEEGICCVVTDNGRGRVAAKKIASEQGGMHLSIASVNSAKRINFLHDLGFNNAQVEIKDLYVDGSPSGTSVYISLPFIQKTNTGHNATSQS
jgi:LytS/YehU family sensor histidine kinase